LEKRSPVLVISCLRIAIATSLSVAMIAPSVRAQAPFAGQGAQMPDPKRISGVPLPVSDVPVGTVTVRVIKGQLSNTLPGQTVELIVAGERKTAETDAAGRATFAGLTAGARAKASVTVGSERIESRDFDIPAAGGVRLMLVATDAATEEKAAADRKLAEGPAVSGAVVIGDQSRFVLEIGDDALNVFHIFQIVNTAKRPVQTDAPIVFELPRNAGAAGMLEGSTPNAVAAGNRVTVNGPFAPGNTIVQFAYSIPLGPSEITVAQKMPVQMTQLAVIAQKVGGMQLVSPQVAQRREMPAEGQTFIVGQGGAVKAGETVTLTLTGLPSRPSWPKKVALALSALILAGGAWGAFRGGATPDQNARRARLHAERDRLFSELASLEAERRKGTVDPQAYASRRGALVGELEDLYAGLDR
jgi:hypothetical protein